MFTITYADGSYDKVTPDGNRWRVSGFNTKHHGTGYNSNHGIGDIAARIPEGLVPDFVGYLLDMSSNEPPAEAALAIGAYARGDFEGAVQFTRDAGEQASNALLARRTLGELQQVCPAATVEVIVGLLG